MGRPILREGTVYSTHSAATTATTTPSTPPTAPAPTPAAPAAPAVLTALALAPAVFGPVALATTSLAVTLLLPVPLPGIAVVLPNTPEIPDVLPSIPSMLAAVVVAGMAAATLWAQEQTPAAAEMTSTPVRGPQALRTQPWAMELMATDWEGEHWQMKSWGSQETAAAAELMQDFW